MMTKLIYKTISTAAALLAVLVLTAQSVTISPEYPQRGDKVTITFDPRKTATKAIGPDAPAVTLVFSYSNLYDVPYRIALEKKGDVWTTSFVLARYATFATFYLQSGDKVEKPEGRHYELYVYDKKKPVENTYLYRGYSLSAQMPKGPAVEPAQVASYKKELELYPGNYEAKVRLAAYQIKTAQGAQKEMQYAAALKVIADKFNSAPTTGGNLNKVTMGYLILGENARVDSIRKVVVARYPNTELAWEYYTGFISKEKDTAEQIALFEKALQQETVANPDAFNGMHARLFELYAARKDSAKTLYHARQMLSEKANPHKPLTYKHLTQTLLDNNLALDTAAYYAAYTLSIADSFPVGVIRYFPETGYIYPYTTDSMRQAVYNKARGNMLSMLAVINYKRGQLDVANKNIDDAIKASIDKETTDNAIWLYKQTNQTAKLEQLQAIRLEHMSKEVARKRINVQAPSLKHFTTLDGKAIDTASLKGKVVLIDFWATWCVPCMEEMPYVQKLYDVYKNNPNVVFMIVNSGARNTLADAQKWGGNKKYSFPVYFNTDPAVGDKFKFTVIPATYVIAPDGNIAFSNIGFEGPDIEMKLKLQIEMALH